MFQDLKTYPEYVSAELPWLDRYPAHWTKLRMKQVLHAVDSRSTTGEEELLTVSSARGVVPRKSQAVTMFKAASYVGHKLASPGDLVINALWAWGRGVGVSRHFGIVSTAYGVYRSPFPELLDTDFLHLYVRSEPYNWELRERSRGIWISRLQLTDDRFLASPLVAPPIEEQKAIVTYLAHAHQRINRAIAAKQRLIELLEELMQVEIRKAVLCGLNDSAPTREPGVEWFGTVPAHWEVSALRFHYSQELGKMLDAKRITGDYLLPYLRNTDVQWGAINTADLPEMDISEAEYGRYTVRNGDLLVCEGGEVGRSAIWRGSGTLGYQKALHRLRVLDTARDVPEFPFWLLRCAVWAGAFNDGRVSTIAHLTGDKLRAHRLPWPPLDEQRQIVAWVDEVVSRTTQRRDAVRREIDLLEEFRVRLSADVITGQVDVRSIAANLSPMDLADVLAASPVAGNSEEDETADEVGMEDE